MSIKQWFRRWLYEEDQIKLATLTLGSGHNAIRSESFGTPVRFSLFTARGGVIVTVKSYDSVRDRDSETTYVIHETDNFEQNLLNIINMERIKL
jgi:hypothetical protein